MAHLGIDGAGEWGPLTAAKRTWPKRAATSQSDPSRHSRSRPAITKSATFFDYSYRVRDAVRI